MNPGIIPTSTYLQGDQATPSAQPQPQPQAQGNQPSWWQRLLPAVGGIGATLLAPETGGASLLADAALFGLGSAGGKLAENVTSGAPATQGVASTGLESGATGLLGGGLVKGAGSVLSGIGSKLAGGGANEAGGVIANTADKLGAKMFQGQFNGTLGKTPAENLYNLGITSDKELGQIAPIVTGSNGAFPNALKSGLAEAEDAGHVVNLEGITQTAQNELANHLDVNSNTPVKIGNTITKAINNTARGDVEYVPGIKGQPGTFAYTPGTLSNANPTTVFTQAQQLEKAGYTYLNKSTDAFGNVTNNDGYAIGKTFQATANDLMKRVLTSSGAQIPMSDTVGKQLVSDLSPIKDINPTVYNNLVKNIPDNIGGLRSPQADFVQGSQAIQAMGKAQENSGGLKAKDFFKASTIPSAIGGGVMGGPVGAIGGAVIPALAGSNAGEVLGTKLFSKLGSVGADTGGDISASTAKTANKILPLAVRAGTVAGGTAGNLINDTPQSQNNVQSGAGTTMHQPDVMSTLAQSPLMQAYNTALTGGMGIGSNYTQAMTSLAPEAQKLQQAAPILQQLLGGFGAAGGAQGPLGGLLTKLTGLMPGTAANQYNKEQGAAQAILAQLLGGQASQYAGAMPQLTAAPGTAAPQLGAIQSILGGIGTTPSAIPAQ